MATFSYIGRDQSGRKTSGQINAETRVNAITVLKEKGIATTEINEYKQNVFTKEITITTALKPRELVIFLRQFAALLEAGVSVVQSVQILQEQSEQKSLTRVLTTIQEQVQQGESLSNAMGTHVKFFPPMVIQLTRVGEVSGNLDEAMSRLADYFEKRYEMRQKVISALTYPALLGMVAIAVLNVMLYIVIPRFTSMYANTGKELPELTQAVIALSEFGNRYWWGTLLAIGIFFIGLLMCLKNDTSRFYIDYAILKVPILGRILQKTLIIEFSRTLSSLFTSSVPILQSMTITQNIINNTVYKRMIGEAFASVEEGNSMTVPMKRHRVFPPLVLHMISIGEQTGNLDVMLMKITTFYEAEVEHITERLQALLEPILILILSVVVGIIVLSVVLPMFDLYQNINL
ncbi:type II secretion system F family protein [Alkalihalobacillus sp. AL-G]|uniref:type II secretion system F family protein n=1 Tax=Alkalihalobacillus sp. AL-G TaxID=2926399 RepID=UPI00272A1F07|nr:type II secretion system F family protein [Alkalihalobacillus sp. AL-G]WLD92249.1 type II secretion system F family protein [Alkalihalobacillus sp. AL-G]